MEHASNLNALITPQAIIMPKPMRKLHSIILVMLLFQQRVASSVCSVGWLVGWLDGWLVGWLLAWVGG